MTEPNTATAAVAVLEDNAANATVYRTVLGRAGYRCEIAATVREFLTRCSAEDFDLYLLDWELPDGTAAEVIRWARARRGWSIPIVVASLHSEEERVVEALALGADDFIFKPVRVQELLARIAAHLRKGRPATGDSEAAMEPYTLDLEQRRVLLRGKPVDLTEREYDLLECLYRNKDRLVPRQKLLGEVWGVTADVDTRTVDSHVSRLRRKLGLGTVSPWSIVAAYGHGYRLAHKEDEPR